MLLDLKKIFMTENACVQTVCSLDLTDVTIDGVKPFTSVIKADVLAENCAGFVRLIAKTIVDYKRPCDRCTADTTMRLPMEFTHNLVVTLSGEDNDDYIETPNYQLDLDELLRADIILNLPVKYLCKEECKGLCAQCGKDLNQGDCSCDKRQIDPRLEVLKKLIDSE